MWHHIVMQDAPSAQHRLLLAIEAADIEAARQALAAGADPNAVVDRASPLVDAIGSGPLRENRIVYLGTVRILLDAGADPNLPDEDGTSGALFEAVLVNDAEVMALLLAQGGNPNFLVDGQSLYDWAAWDYAFEARENRQLPGTEEPSAADCATSEARLSWLYRMASKYGFPAPDHLRVMREAGAMTTAEMQASGVR